MARLFVLLVLFGRAVLSPWQPRNRQLTRQKKTGAASGKSSRPERGGALAPGVTVNLNHRYIQLNTDELNRLLDDLMNASSSEIMETSRSFIFPAPPSAAAVASKAARDEHGLNKHTERRQ